MSISYYQAKDKQVSKLKALIGEREALYQQSISRQDEIVEKIKTLFKQNNEKRSSEAILHSERVRQYQQELQQCKEKISKLDEKVRRLQHHQKEIGILEENVQRSCMRYIDLENTHKYVKMNLQNLQNERMQLVKVITRNNSSIEALHIKDILKEISRLQAFETGFASSNDVSELKKQLTWSEGAVRDLETENHKLNIECSAMSDQARSRESIIQHRVHEIHVLNCEVKKYKNLLDQVNHKAHDQNRQKIKKLESENCELHQQLAAMQESTNKLLLQSSSYALENVNLNQQISKLNNTSQHFAVQSDKCHNLESDNLYLKHQMSNLNQTISQLKTENNQLKTYLNKNEDISAHNILLTSRYQQNMKENFNLKEQLSKLQETSNKLEMENASIKCDLESKVRDCQRLESKCREFQSLHDSKQEKMNEIVSRLQRDLKDKDDFSIPVAHMKQKLEIKENENNTLKGKYTEKIKNLETIIGNLKVEMQNKTKEIERLQNIVNNLSKSEKDSKCLALERIVQEKDDKINDLSTRLSTEMNSKLATNERSLENISIKNRPMNIASEYEMICANEWHDAKGWLDNVSIRLSEDEKIQLLSTIFVLTETQATKYKTLLVENVHKMLADPLSFVSNTQSAAVDNFRGDALPKELTLLVGDVLRLNADTAVIGSAVQEIKLQLMKTSSDLLPNKTFSNDPHFSKFIEVCFRLAWKMALQRPPMCYKQDGLNEPWRGENKQELFWSSSNPDDSRSRVKYYVHPALYHGDTLMVKGRVYLAIY